MCSPGCLGALCVNQVGLDLPASLLSAGIKGVAHQLELLAPAQDLIMFLGFYLFIFYVHWCYAFMYVWVRVSGPLELELQSAVSCHVGDGN